MPLTRSALVIGGARSGKSRYAQALAESSGLKLVYCATATLRGDVEMAERVARHRAERDARWRTVEAPMELCDTLGRETGPDRLVLVDCLTLWLTNVILAERDPTPETLRLAGLVPALPGPVVFVSNEVGAGIVPRNALTRAFRDAQGRLNQAMGSVCDAVVLVAAGLPLRLKPAADPGLVLGV